MSLSMSLCTVPHVWQHVKAAVIISSGDIWPISLTWRLDLHMLFSLFRSSFIVSSFFKAWYMSFFPPSHISGELVVVLGHFRVLCVSSCQLVCWLKHARSLTLLPDWRHTMPSGWFMTSVAHRRSCCETPLPSASIWGVLEFYSFFFLTQGSGCISFDIDPVKLIFFLMLQAIQLALAEFALCSSLTVLWVLVASHWLCLCVFVWSFTTISSDVTGID